MRSFCRLSGGVDDSHPAITDPVRPPSRRDSEGPAPHCPPYLTCPPLPTLLGDTRRYPDVGLGCRSRTKCSILPLVWHSWFQIFGRAPFAIGVRCELHSMLEAVREELAGVRWLEKVQGLSLSHDFVDC